MLLPDHPLAQPDTLLSYLTVQTAACILVAVEHRNKLGPDQLGDEVMLKVAEYGRWVNRNNLEAQVAFLYRFVEHTLQNPDESRFLADWSRRVIADALQAYQDWKTRYVAAEKINNNAPNWGEATPFNRADWANLNAAFLAQ